MRRSAMAPSNIRQTIVVSLALNPLTDAAELVGQEIRNHLNYTGIRERFRAVHLPLNWILSLQPSTSGNWPRRGARQLFAD